MTVLENSCHKKRWNLAICDNMDGSPGYYAKWNKSEVESQIPYDLTHKYKVKTPTFNFLKLISVFRAAIFSCTSFESLHFSKNAFISSTVSNLLTCVLLTIVINFKNIHFLLLFHNVNFEFCCWHLVPFSFILLIFPITWFCFYWAWLFSS